MKTDNLVLISLLGSTRTEQAVAHAREVFDNVIVSPGVRPDPSRLLHKDVRGMEAYNDVRRFRGAYPARALGCRLAGLNAMRLGAMNFPDGFYVAQDDFEIPDVQFFKDKLAVAPSFADCLWLDRGQITKGISTVTAHGWEQTLGAKLCTLFWISTPYVLDMLPRLEEANCEWDIFMQDEMKTRLFFVPDKRICNQRHGESEITGDLKW